MVEHVNVEAARKAFQAATGQPASMLAFIHAVRKAEQLHLACLAVIQDEDVIEIAMDAGAFLLAAEATAKQMEIAAHGMSVSEFVSFYGSST